MAQKTKFMLRNSLEALIHSDSKRAKDVLAADDEIDDLHRQMYRVFQNQVKQDASQTPIYLQYLSVSRHLERIADHATNIAEDVIYIVDGEIVRHGSNEIEE